MRFDDVWIAGTGGVLGDLVPIGEAVAAGRYDSWAAAASGMVSYSVSAQAPPEMAVVAGREALKEAAEFGVEAGPDLFFVHSLWFPPNRGGLLYAASRSGAAVFS